MDILTYASIQVMIDNQAWLYAAHTLGTDGPEEEFQAAMQEWKDTSATLIEEVVVSTAEELGYTEDDEGDDNGEA